MAQVQGFVYLVKRAILGNVGDDDIRHPLAQVGFDVIDDALALFLGAGGYHNGVAGCASAQCLR